MVQGRAAFGMFAHIAQRGLYQFCYQAVFAGDQWRNRSLELWVSRFRNNQLLGISGACLSIVGEAQNQVSVFRTCGHNYTEHNKGSVAGYSVQLANCLQISACRPPFYCQCGDLYCVFALLALWLKKTDVVIR